jgi:hypothetical protein
MRRLLLGNLQVIRPSQQFFRPLRHMKKAAKYQ